MTSPVLRVRAVRYDDPDAQKLIAAVQAEYVVRYGGPDETSVDVTEFDPPGGLFVVGVLGPVPVACGGWRRREDVSALGSTRAAEIKRMFVVPGARRAGHARAVLAHLEQTAREAGAEVAIAETGTAQPEAISLYASSGYQPIPGFGIYAANELNRCYARRLA